MAETGTESHTRTQTQLRKQKQNQNQRQNQMQNRVQRMTHVAKLHAGALLQGIGRLFRSAWKRQSDVERVAAALGSVLAIGLVMALVHTCQQSVLRGERFRAGQHQEAGLAGRQVVHIATGALADGQGL